MSIEELKELILWCKANKVKSLSRDGNSFELSELAFIETLNVPEAPIYKEINLDSSKAPVDTIKLSPEEEEELRAYWLST